MGGWEVGMEKYNERSGIVVETDIPYCDEGLLGSFGVTVQHHEKEIHRAQHAVFKTAMKLQAYW